MKINEQLLNEVKDFLDRYNVAEHFKNSLDETGPIWLRKKAGEEKLIALDASFQDGGSGANALTMGAIYKECGKIDINTREFLGLGHARLISEYGNEQQKNELLSDIFEGENLVGVGITEEGTGSDFAAINTMATKVPGGYLLNGEKTYVSRVDEASHFIVFAKTKEGYSARNISAFIVPTANLERIHYTPMGLKGWSYGGIIFNNLFIPENSLLGNEGEGFSYFNRHFAYWRILMTMLCIGSAEQATENAIQYANERQAFGGPIARFQTVMHKISENLTNLKAAELLCIDALQAIDEGKDATKQAAMAKWYGTEVAYKAIDQTIQILGARGYLAEYGLEKRLRDARGVMIADGSNDTLKSLIGREAFGKDTYNLMYGRKNKEHTSIPVR